MILPVVIMSDFLSSLAWLIPHHWPKSRSIRPTAGLKYESKLFWLWVSASSVEIRLGIIKFSFGVLQIKKVWLWWKRMLESPLLTWWHFSVPLTHTHWHSDPSTCSHTHAHASRQTQTFRDLINCSSLHSFFQHFLRYWSFFTSANQPTKLLSSPCGHVFKRRCSHFSSLTAHLVFLSADAEVFL